METESITVHASYESTRLPSARLRSLLFSYSISEAIINDCELALHELLTNLVDHAYEGDENQLITVNLTCNPKMIVIETLDTGSPSNIDFDKIAMPEPMEMAEGGYGLAIIQSVMDEVKYQSDHGENIWQLIKHL